MLRPIVLLSCLVACFAQPAFAHDATAKHDHKAGLWQTRTGKFMADANGAMVITSKDGKSVMMMHEDGIMMMMDAHGTLVWLDKAGKLHTVKNAAKTEEGKLLREHLATMKGPARGTL